MWRVPWLRVDQMSRGVDRVQRPEIVPEVGLLVQVAHGAVAVARAHMGARLVVEATRPGVTLRGRRAPLLVAGVAASAPFPSEQRDQKWLLSRAGIRCVAPRR
jgi:hypothetical protein